MVCREKALRQWGVNGAAPPKSEVGFGSDNVAITLCLDVNQHPIRSDIQSFALDTP